MNKLLQKHKFLRGFYYFYKSILIWYQLIIHKNNFFPMLSEEAKWKLWHKLHYNLLDKKWENYFDFLYLYQRFYRHLEGFKND